MLKRVFSVVMFILLLTSMLTLAFNIQPVKAEPRTWTVDDDGPADFHTIQEAVNAASNGDTIYVHNGTYYENVWVNQTVSLVGENRDNTIVDGNGTGPYGTIWLINNNSSISGFTVRNGEYGVVVYWWGLLPTFTGNRIEDNQIINNLYGGILLRSSANNTVSNNFLANNTLFGIHLLSSADNIIVNNTVSNSKHGLTLEGYSNNNILRNNNMTGNTYNFGLIIDGQTANFVGGTPARHGVVNDIDSSNTVNGKPIYFWDNRSDEHVPTDAGYVWLNDCNNITVKGCSLSNNLQGILLLFSNNTSIVDNNITGNAYGIYEWIYSNNNTIVGNTLEDNLNGIYLAEVTKFTTMRNNSISGGQMNFGIPPQIYSLSLANSANMDPLVELVNDIDVSNTVDGRSIIYWINQHDQKVPTDAGCVILINCTNILVEGLNLSKNVQGVLAVASNNTIITDNSISDTVYAIDAKGYRYWSLADDEWSSVDYTSFDTTVKRNIIVDNGVGMRISSNSSIITNNTLLRDPLGIYLPDTFGSIISGNLVSGSDIWSLLEMHRFPEMAPFFPEEAWVDLSPELRMLEVGAMILGSSNNLIHDNTFADSFVGISTIALYTYGSLNLIFHNNMINDTFPAAHAPGINIWNNAYPSGGNYWSDYNGTDLYSGPYQNETGSDGIGDTPYTIDTINIDWYPLVKPYGFVLGDINLDRIVDISDAILAALAFGSYPGHPNWNGQADLNHDNIIDIFDIIMLANNFGKH